MVERKLLLLLSVVGVSWGLVFSQPRDPKPRTPDAIYRNDLDVWDALNFRIKTTGNSTCIDLDIFCVNRVDGQVLIGDGTVLQPGLAFLNDTNTGIYRPGANQIVMIAGGVGKFGVDSAGGLVATSGYIQNEDGTAGSPSWSYWSDPDTGRFRSSNNEETVSAGGVPVARFGSTGVQIMGSISTVPTSFVGNVVSSVSASNQNTGATGVGTDALTISLASGNWLASGFMNYTRNDSTFTTTTLYIGLSTFPGNNFTGLSLGNNAYQIMLGTATKLWTTWGLSVPDYYVQNGTGTYTYYLKSYASGFTAGQPLMKGRITVIRQP